MNNPCDAPYDMPYDVLETKIGYRFRQRNLLERALTHASAIDKSENNKEMEFLGDRVLGLAIARYLFSHPSHFSVGQMAQNYNHLVSRSLCALVSKKLNLLDYTHHSKSITNDQNHHLAVHANLIETLIAAIYLDSGFDEAYQFIENFWGEWLSDCLDDKKTQSPKSALQEKMQSLGCDIPIYEVISRKGPDHAPLFKVRVQSGQGSAIGLGTSRLIAEKDAARLLLRQMDV